MSKARHKKMDNDHDADDGYARGGMIGKGRESEEESEMMGGHKKGGKVGRKRGGHVEHGEGEKPKMHRLDRPGRKRGGGVGADRMPLSSASKTSAPSGMSGTDSGEASGKQ